MKIALLGYGKMGKMIEQLVERTGENTIVLKVDSNNRSALSIAALQQADVAIEFSNPASVLENIQWCFEAAVPVIVGTTGWYEHLDEVKAACFKENASVLFASNFSIGVNIFFALNRKLAQWMTTKPGYEPRIEETHHKAKKDAPSGTAITLANDLIQYSTFKEKWAGYLSQLPEALEHNPSELIILSRRENDVAGTHQVSFKSANDQITITHEAFNREGFAAGALAAAAWLMGKKGFFEFRDVINEL